MTTTPSRPFARLSRAACAAVPAVLLAAGLTACGGDDAGGEGGSDDALVIYSGRNENLVGGLLDQLEETVGTPVEVRYGTSAELAAQLLEEGDATEADVFFSQDAGALGALGRADLLTDVDPSVTGAVDERFVDAGGKWVGTSARARVLAYDPTQVPDVQQITSIDAVLEPQYRGKIGFAPTNASFQAFVTALRVDRGEDGAREWLTRFSEQEPVAFDNNLLVLDAVDGGEVALGLINHYYWFEKVAEVGVDEVNARLHYLDADDPGALINVAGVGVLQSTDQQEAADKAVEFLLSDTAQQYFADETAEYPVVAGITTTKHDLVPLADLQGSSIDLNDLDDLEGTLTLLDEVGLT